jgi:hypothetical protein
VDQNPQSARKGISRQDAKTPTKKTIFAPLRLCVKILRNPQSVPQINTDEHRQDTQDAPGPGFSNPVHPVHPVKKCPASRALPFSLNFSYFHLVSLVFSSRPMKKSMSALKSCPMDIPRCPLDGHFLYGPLSKKPIKKDFHKVMCAP